MGKRKKYFRAADPTEVVAMVDASFSRQRAQEDRVAGVRRQLSIFAVGLAIILTGLGWALLQRGFSGNSPPGSSIVAAAAPEQVSNELIETTKGLQITQQQAVDQLQVVQDQLVAQKAETKKLSEQIAAVTEKLDALQQSVANAPAVVGKSR
jgi:uncharacterized coiled-coil protein SlyX